MSNSNYISECTQLLQAFELTQAEMLEKNYVAAAGEFAEELERMKVLFGGEYSDLTKTKIVEPDYRNLLIRQIERLLLFMKEFTLHLDELLKQKSIREEQVLFIFERQYKFKRIYKKHLEDFRKIEDSTQ